MSRCDCVHRPFTLFHSGNSGNGMLEPRHDKTNKMSVRPAKTQISLGIRPVWSVPSLSRLIWDFAGHSHFVGFVMSRLICSAIWSTWWQANAIVGRLMKGHHFSEQNMSNSHTLKSFWGENKQDNFDNPFEKEEKFKLLTLKVCHYFL